MTTNTREYESVPHDDLCITEGNASTPEEEVEEEDEEEDDDDDHIYINEETESGREKVLVSHAPQERIVPPLNFCPVERYLYRSGQPSPVNFPFLLNLKLKTIIWLSNEEPQDTLLEFCDTHRINLQFAAINPDAGEDDNPWDLSLIHI